jgi:hypothetical protein
MQRCESVTKLSIVYTSSTMGSKITWLMALRKTALSATNLSRCQAVASFTLNHDRLT